MSNISKINNLILDKLSKRGKILKKSIQFDEPRVFKLNYKIKRTPYAGEAKTLEKKIKLINHVVFNKDIDYNVDHNECTSCDLVDGFFIFKPFYINLYLDKFYQIIDETFNNNRDDPTFTYQNNKKRVFLFDNLNLYEVLEHCNKINPRLTSYLLRYIVDILYLLKVPIELISEFMQKSKLVIVRYEQGSGIHSHIDNIKRGNGAVVTMSLGPDYNVYDLIPVDNTNDSLRIFFKKGSVLIMDGKARYLWAHATPKNFTYTPTELRYSIVLLSYEYKKNNIDCFNSEVYNDVLCGYYNKNFFKYD
ncbi:alkylated dna repair protein alkb-like 8 isoform x1 [Tupanvirus deep ocean]|uniref:Alkylated dna repair protein alkb-like 8 isoform x1 n=2 Tax=Tupanvirus TaxID=2094720 RepID=A0AC62A791_9VIRU|nr:alkylated dna repair protein alkb-like 8 isoform x1 [Tupanvirus deep ocean]QKU33488.1 alkylated dna repair protein alkb-like 8 isoform x1 [Tupanvirus deep ocean]